MVETVDIGGQTWMLLNLDTDRFLSGEQIHHASTDEDWTYCGENGIPAWCKYNNDVGLDRPYGRLYNFYAVTAAAGLAPAGFRVATVADWHTLVQHQGGALIAGKALKSAEYWSNQGGGNNSSGFGAIPGGGRGAFGSFIDLGDYGVYWAIPDSPLDPPSFCYFNFMDSQARINADGFRESGLSVRCIKIQQ